AGSLPMLVKAPAPGLYFMEALGELKLLVAEPLYSAGGILFRGFEVGAAEAFREIAAVFADPILNYEIGSTPRSNVTKALYT
ncbi:TauD/TfdA family dioxygenase, partial [Pseudomonas syringae pv. tagetis]